MNENHPAAVQPMQIIILQGIHLPRARQHVQVVKDGVVAVPAAATLRKKIPPPQIMKSRTRRIKRRRKRLKKQQKKRVQLINNHQRKKGRIILHGVHFRVVRILVLSLSILVVCLVILLQVVMVVEGLSITTLMMPWHQMIRKLKKSLKLVATMLRGGEWNHRQIFVNHL